MSVTRWLVVGCAFVALAVLAWVIYRRPQRGLIVLAGLTPLHGVLAILPEEISFAGWKEALVGLTLVCACVRRMCRPREDPTPIPLHMPWWPAAVALLVFGSVSALVTAGVVGLFAIKISFFYLTVVLILWLAPFDARDRDHLLTVLMGMGVFTSIVGLAQQVVGPAYLVGLGYDYGDQVRTAGGVFRSFSTFNQPFPFGLYVMLSVLVGGAVALAEPRRRRNALFMCATPVMVLAMGTSIVRASILGLLAGLIWLAIHRYRALFVLLAALVVAFAVALPFIPPGVTDALFSSESLGQRGQGWADILTSVAQHPFGLGLGVSGSAADRIADAQGRAGAITYQPDNYYVKIVLELGPIGLWLLLILLIAAVVWTLRVSRRVPGRDGALALGVSASCVAALAASWVATYFEIFPLDVYFWLLLGVVGCAAAQHESRSARSPSGRAGVGYRPTRANY